MLQKVEVNNVVGFDKKGEYVMRPSGTAVKGFVQSFGNPFMKTTTVSEANTIDDNNMGVGPKTAGAMYYEWLLNNKVPEAYNKNKKDLADRREHILSNLSTINNAANLKYTYGDRTTLKALVHLARSKANNATVAEEIKKLFAEFGEDSAERKIMLQAIKSVTNTNSDLGTVLGKIITGKGC